MNLFEFNDQIRELQKRDDLDPDVLADTLESLELSRNEKLDNVAAWIEKNNMQLDWLKKKTKTLNETKSALQKQTDSLMRYLTSVIDDTGYKKIQTDRYELKPRNYRASVVISDSDRIPSKYRNYAKYEGMYDVDKKAVYQDLKDGKDVPGAKLKPNRKTVIK